MNDVDLVIVGAGIRGLAVAKTYHKVHPDRSLLIFDFADTVGGCWAEERIYPSLRTNNQLGSYEFSDFAMTPELAGVGYGNFIPGAGVHRYLSEAAKFYGLENFLRLGTKVQSALLRADDLWEISFSTRASSTDIKKIVTKKLVIATGAQSNPYMPLFPGQDDFQGLLIHYAALNHHSAELARDKNVVIVGSNKAALDTSYLVAQGDGTAHMVIRPSGGGPSYSWPRVKFLGSISVVPLLTATRVYTLFDPWPFATSNPWLRNFLHRWTVGLAITKTFWSMLGQSFRAALGNDPRVDKLIPWYSTYWMGISLSSQNYPTDWAQFVRDGRIVVHYADVISLSSTSVQLTDGTLSNVDALVACTGWKVDPTVKILPKDVEESVGFPMMKLDLAEAQIRQVREGIYQKRPALMTAARHVGGKQCSGAPPIRNASPYRLYRWLAPSSERLFTARNLAILNADNPLFFTLCTEVQALWITAFFEGKLRHSNDVKRIQQDTILWSEYERIRHPPEASGRGETIGEFVFDGVPYIDNLMEDLGLQPRRKKTLYQEWFTPYGKDDYRTIVQEWMDANGIHTKS